MATLVALKASLSATTASFFAALSTASSLRLAVVAHWAGPPGCTRRPTLHLNPEAHSRKTRRARRHLEACPPEAFASRGVSRFEPNYAHAALESDAKRNPVFTRLCRPCD